MKNTAETTQKPKTDTLPIPVPHRTRLLLIGPLHWPGAEGAFQRAATVWARTPAAVSGSLEVISGIDQGVETVLDYVGLLNDDVDQVAFLRGWSADPWCVLVWRVARQQGLVLLDEDGGELGDLASGKVLTGKVPWGLVPFEALEGLPGVFANGNTKYGRDSWRRGERWTEYVGAFMRHLRWFRSGCDLDRQSGLHHLDHMLCNLVILRWMTLHRLDLDDRLDVDP